MAALLAVVLTLFYPLTIWIVEGRIEPRVLAGILLLTGFLRIYGGHYSRETRWWAGGTILIVFLAVWANVMFPLKLYPVIVNATLLGVFGYSLLVPPTVAERIARAQNPRLPEAASGYTRRVTQIWCLFFALNGAIALYTALYSSSAVWSFYNGVLAYFFIGLLFAGEHCVRRRVMERQSG